MPGPPPRRIELSARDRSRLTKTANGYISSYRDRLRARIIPDAADGYSNAAIAGRWAVSTDTVRKWRGRFAA